MTAHPVDAPPAPLDTDLERAAAEWITPYPQRDHLLRTRDWLLWLDPDARLEMRLAALLHDIERMFPGGPRLDAATNGWDDPWYLFAHSTRSAELVTVWLHAQKTPHDLVHGIRRLIALHEVGGPDGADEVQAADSLSFLETLTDPSRLKVTGTVTPHLVAEKFQLMARRVRIPEARQVAEELLEQALEDLQNHFAPQSGKATP